MTRPGGYIEIMDMDLEYGQPGVIAKRMMESIRNPCRTKSNVLSGNGRPSRTLHLMNATLSGLFSGNRGAISTPTNDIPSTCL